MKKFLEQQSVKKQIEELTCLVGFDGFIDSIYRVVKCRKTASAVSYMTKMEEFSDRIIQSHDKSTNLELVLQETRLGGNGPILANALITLGTQVSIIGALGTPDIDPHFLPLQECAKNCISIAPSGKTDALEFTNGKILLGKHQSLLTLDEKAFISKKFIELLASSTLFASVNWTMLYGMTEAWKILEAEVLPTIPQKPSWMFVDLADPAKRTDDDIKEALETLGKLQNQIKVVLGLNVAEAERVAKVLHCPARAQAICHTLGLEQVVVHAIESAEASDGSSTKIVKGPVVTPKITTGGGDNFNAGYLLGCGLNLRLEECLLLATYTSGYYVAKGKSPTMAELIGFLP